MISNSLTNREAIQLLEHTPPNLVDWIRFPVEPYQRLEKRYLCPSSLVLGVNVWMQGNSSRAVLTLACYQCSIHCESNRVEHSAEYEMGAAAEHL